MQSAPQAPDPYQTAAAQTASNKQTGQTQQELNMVNQTNPFGSLTYSQAGTNADGTPQYTASTTLTPQVQKLLTGFQNLQRSQQGAAQTLLNSGAGALGGKPLDLSYGGTAASLDALNRARLDPQWAQNTDIQESKLANQGITPGTPAYDNAMRVFNQGKNDAYNSANLADYQAAANTATQQYMAPVQAYGALASGTSPTMPSFMNTPTVNVPGTNISGLIEDNYKQQSANANAANGQMAGIFGTALGLGTSALTGMPSGTFGGLFGKGGSSPGFYNTQ